MREVFGNRFRAAALATALVVALVAPGAYAEEEPSPFDPPEARIRVPTGSPSSATTSPTTTTTTAGGQTTSNARIRVPTGEPEEGEPEADSNSTLRLFFGWLELKLGMQFR